MSAAFSLHLSKNAAGFTVLELLVVITLLSIVAAIGTPELSKMQESFNRFNARSHLLEDIKRAQAETVTEGCRGILALAADGESYSFGCDYLGYDASANPQPDSVKFTRVLPSRIFISASGPIIFDSRGQAVDTGGIVSNTTVTLKEGGSEGAAAAFQLGTLLGTGVFTYE